VKSTQRLRSRGSLCRCRQSFLEQHEPAGTLSDSIGTFANGIIFLQNITVLRGLRTLYFCQMHSDLIKREQSPDFGNKSRQLLREVGFVAAASAKFIGFSPSTYSKAAAFPNRS
jgi:hypothetical protein